ncbi:MAG: TonB-dependent receptor [Planctomycetota bacterium]
MTLRRPACILSMTLLCVALEAVEDSSALTAHPTVPAWTEDTTAAAAPTYSIREQDITTRGGVRSLIDWLREVPGTQVINVGGGFDGGNGDVRRRGMAGAYTQIVLDGIPVNDPSSIMGDMNLSVFNPSGVERIDMQHGPSSGANGSRSMAGTMHIRTLRPSDNHHESVTFGMGSNRLLRCALQASGPIDDLTGYAVSGEVLGSSGFSAQTAELNADPSPHENDAVRRVSAGLRLERQVSRELELYGAITAIHEEQQLDEIGPDDSVPGRNVRLLRLAGGGSAWINAMTSAQFDLAFTDIWQRVDTSNGPLAITPSPMVGPSTYDPTVREFHGSERYARLILATEYTPDVRLRGGLDARYDLAGQGYQGHLPEWEEHERIFGAFIEGRCIMRNLDVEASGRVDHHDGFGSLATGRIAAAWTPANEDWLTLRAALSSGFRAPSLYERLGSHLVGDFGFGPVTYVGNPDLQPEHVTNVEIGVAASCDHGIELSATAFRWVFTDKIDYNYYSSPYTYNNLKSQANVIGVESQLSAKHIRGSSIDCAASFTAMKSADGLGNSLAFVPGHLFGLRVTAHQEPNSLIQTWLSLGVNHTGFYYGLDQEKGYLPSYTIVQASAGMTIDDTWDVIVRIDNVFNKHYGQTAPFDLSGDTIPDHINSSQPRTYELTLRGRF